MDQLDLFGKPKPKPPAAPAPAAPAAPLTGRQRSVLELLSDGQWHTTVEICGPTVGGSEGTRRLRELRASGYTIQKQGAAKVLGGRATSQYAYRLVTDEPIAPQGPGVPPPGAPDPGGGGGGDPSRTALKPYVFKGQGRCGNQRRPGCNFPLLWFETPNGKRMPINDGRGVRIPAIGEEIPPDTFKAEYLTRSHWGTCSQRQKFRS